MPQLDEAQLTRDRTIRLWNQELVARAQLDSAEFGLQVAEGRYQDAIEEVRNRQAILVQRRSEVALARQQLTDTALVSPIDGAVSQRAGVGRRIPGRGRARWSPWSARIPCACACRCPNESSIG